MVVLFGKQGVALQDVLFGKQGVTGGCTLS